MSAKPESKDASKRTGKSVEKPLSASIVSEDKPTSKTFGERYREWLEKKRESNGFRSRADSITERMQREGSISKKRDAVDRLLGKK
jgi:hypothetical protein